MARWALVALLASAAAFAGEERTYPKGASQQVWEGRSFDLRVPDDYDAAKEYSLIVTLSSSLEDLAPLLADGYILCRTYPRIDPVGGMWSGGEIQEVLDLTAHLEKALSIGEGRVHTTARSESRHSIGPLMVFGKKSPFVSACFDNSGVGQGSVAKRAKKELGVLAFGREVEPGSKGDLLGRLRGRVRVAVVRDDPKGVTSAYYRFFVGAMEGRFKPGETLVFDWAEDPADAKQLAVLEERAKSESLATILYFWSADDAENADAKALQNGVFFEQSVRSPVGTMLAVKLDVSKHGARFETLALDETPAVVVLDHEGGVARSFTGVIKAKSLAKTPQSAAKKAAKAR